LFLMIARPRYTIALPGRAPLELGARTLVMGIVNVTPDSFADGGERFDPDRAIADGLRMIADGADILDVGGESTRPGAEPVDADEELRRVLPVVAALAADGRVPVSVDTYKAVVAREAIARGATIVNDVSGFQHDDALAGVVAAAGAAVVLTHNRGRSRTMYREATYTDVVGEIAADLRAAIGRGEAGGVGRASIVVDPGFGFAKRAEHTWVSLAGLPALAAALDRPILAGPSRKSFLTSAIGERPPAERDPATAAAVAVCVFLGAHIVRVHNVRAMVDAVRVADRVREAGYDSLDHR
jgi:dihydropteroate synthase